MKTSCWEHQTRIHIVYNRTTSVTYAPQVSHTHHKCHIRTTSVTYAPQVSHLHLLPVDVSDSSILSSHDQWAGTRSRVQVQSIEVPLQGLRILSTVRVHAGDAYNDFRERDFFVSQYVRERAFRIQVPACGVSRWYACSGCARRNFILGSLVCMQN